MTHLNKKLIIELDLRDGKKLPIYSCDDNFVNLRAADSVVLGSFIEGNDPETGSLGGLRKAYQIAEGKDFLPVLYNQLFSGQNSLDSSDLRAGMKFGRLNLPSCSVFASLWVMQLPETYSSDDLSILYAFLKKKHEVFITRQ